MSGSMPVVIAIMRKPMVPVGARTVTCALPVTVLAALGQRAFQALTAAVRNRGGRGRVDFFARLEVTLDDFEHRRDIVGASGFSTPRSGNCVPGKGPVAEEFRRC